jgi:hypothetical protein
MHGLGGQVDREDSFAAYGLQLKKILKKHEDAGQH